MEQPLKTVYPGHRYRHNLVLNEWYAFTEAGDYRILLELPSADGSGIVARSELLLHIDKLDDHDLDMKLAVAVKEFFEADELTAGSAQRRANLFASFAYSGRRL